MMPDTSPQPLRQWTSLPILATLAVIALLGVFPVQDFDLFWHLANGRAMVAQHTIINQEIFSFTSFGKHFSNHAWLAQILLFLIFKALGANGLIAAKILLTTAIGACLYRFARSQGLTQTSAALVWLLAYGASHARYVVRPELFSSLFLALTGVLLFTYRRAPQQWKILLALPVIMVLWDCMHGALYGVIFIAAFMAGETARSLSWRKAESAFPTLSRAELKTLWLWIGVTIALMLISPYGLRSYDIFLEFAKNNTMTSMTAEFQPTGLGEQPLFWGLLIVSLVSVLASGRRLDPTSLAVLIPFAGMAVRYVRGIGPLSIVAAVILAINLPPLLSTAHKTKAGNGRRPLAGGLILIAGLSYALYYKFSPPPRYDSWGLGISSDGFPVGSTRFVKAAHLAGNMYNTDRYGGYLAYYLYPERKIFHYNHHMLFTALERYVHEPETRAQWQINYAIIGRSDEWDMFTKDGFIPVYWEPTGAVLLKDTPGNKAIIDRYRIRYFSPLMPKEEFFRLAQKPMIRPTLIRETSDYLSQRHDPEKTGILCDLLSARNGLTDQTAIELLTAAERYNGENPKLAAALGTFYYQLSIPDKAERYLNKALALDPNQIEARFSLAYLLYDQQKFQDALDHFNKILATNPKHPETLYGVGLCAMQLGKTKEAAQAFRSYLTLTPDGPWAEQARNFLNTIPLGS